MVATPLSCRGVAQDVLSTSQLAERNWHLPFHMFSDGSDYVPKDEDLPRISQRIEKVAHDACLRLFKEYNLCDVVIDIGQSVKYVPYHICAAPCFLPSSQFIRDSKVLSVLSMFSLQGIFPADYPFLCDPDYVVQKGWTGI